MSGSRQGPRVGKGQEDPARVGASPPQSAGAWDTSARSPQSRGGVRRTERGRLGHVGEIPPEQGVRVRPAQTAGGLGHVGDDRRDPPERGAPTATSVPRTRGAWGSYWTAHVSPSLVSHRKAGRAKQPPWGYSNTEIARYVVLVVSRNPQGKGFKKKHCHVPSLCACVGNLGDPAIGWDLGTPSKT